MYFLNLVRDAIVSKAKKELIGKTISFTDVDGIDRTIVCKDVDLISDGSYFCIVFIDVDGLRRLCHDGDGLDIYFHID